MNKNSSGICTNKNSKIQYESIAYNNTTCPICKAYKQGYNQGVFETRIIAFIVYVLGIILTILYIEYVLK